MRVLVQRFDAETADEDENKSKIDYDPQYTVLMKDYPQNGQIKGSKIPPHDPANLFAYNCSFSLHIPYTNGKLDQGGRGGGDVRMLKNK